MAEVSNTKPKRDFASMYAKRQFRINHVPIDSRPQSSRWSGRYHTNSVG